MLLRLIIALVVTTGAAYAQYGGGYGQAMNDAALEGGKS
jgi:hypothetical protein